MAYNDPMREVPNPYNLAIETSCRQGSVSLGRGDELINTVTIPQPHRHAIELTPAIDRLCKLHRVKPKQIGQVYVSIGPGSFTGLRIAVATAKMFAYVLDARLVAVPTIDVVAENGPTDQPHLAVCLNTKRDQMYAAVYRMADHRWRKIIDPTLMTPAELCQSAPAPLAVMGDHLPDFDWPGHVELLDRTLAVPTSGVVWRIGRDMAHRGEFTDPLKLLPLYARPPEAVELWNKRMEMTKSE